MDCRETRERLSDYRDGSLSETVADGISRHLRECAGCSEVARSLDAVREGLRNLPPVPAPPELLGRIREATAAQPARSLFSRLKTPLETAAAVLLLVSAYWYWTGSPDTTATRPAVPAAPPVEIASRAPAPAVPPAPVQVARATPRTVAAPRPADQAAKPANRVEERSIASLPEDTPDPKVRAYTLADLPASPVLRASTMFRRDPALFPGGRAVGGIRVGRTRGNPGNGTVRGRRPDRQAPSAVPVRAGRVAGNGRGGPGRDGRADPGGRPAPWWDRGRDGPRRSRRHGGRPGASAGAHGAGVHRRPGPDREDPAGRDAREERPPRGAGPGNDRLHRKAAREVSAPQGASPSHVYLPSGTACLERGHFPPRI